MAETTLRTVGQGVLIKRADTFLRNEQATQSPTTATLSSLEIQQDTALEYDSMVLMSKLEQLAVRLNDKTVQASASLSLECLVNIANHLIEFTEKLPMAAAKRFSLDILITRARANYIHLGPQHVRNRRFSVEAFTELHMPQGVMRHPNTFQQLAQDLLHVSNVCLNICMKGFHAPEMRRQWRTVYSGFLVHLAKTVKSMQTNEHYGEEGRDHEQNSCC